MKEIKIPSAYARVYESVDAFKQEEPAGFEVPDQLLARFAENWSDVIVFDNTMGDRMLCYGRLNEEQLRYNVVSIATVSYRDKPNGGIPLQLIRLLAPKAVMLYADIAINQQWKFLNVKPACFTYNGTAKEKTAPAIFSEAHEVDAADEPSEIIVINNDVYEQVVARVQARWPGVTPRSTAYLVGLTN